jgi:glycosyltransferase involved in cell wall biosynthesis
LKKKTILYIIDSLAGIGGAELMLVAPLKDIHSYYNIILVTLYPENVYQKYYFVGDRQYCLNMRSRKDIFVAAKKLKKIIKENDVNFVHSFLYWSVVVARWACGKKTPHIFSLATMMTEHVYTHKWYSGYTRLLDRITYKKNQVVISPTSEVLLDFDTSIGIKGKSKVLHNFVLDDFFKNQLEYKPFSGQLKLVAVGNLKEVKNYEILIEAFKSLKGLPVILDIYGEGLLRDSFQKQITANGLAIKLQGSHNKIYEVLPKYDAFVMSSFLEGFGISAAEAMAIGLPLLLSGIKPLKEISQNNALFFDPYNAQSFVDVIKSILSNKGSLLALSEKGKIIAKENYTKEKYVAGLLNLYEEVLNNELNLK